MDLEKRYEDDVGNKINILQAGSLYPEWAANRIQVGERALSRLSPEEKRASEKGVAANSTIPNTTKATIALYVEELNDRKRHGNGLIQIWAVIEKLEKIAQQ